VFEVDGEAIRDRQARLEQLVNEPAAGARTGRAEYGKFRQLHK
jgi:hypothetical protein